MNDFLETTVCKTAYDYEIRGIPLFDLVTSVPLLFFLLYLLWNLKSSIQKLRETDSLIMSTYYGFVWSVVLYNFF